MELRSFRFALPERLIVVIIISSCIFDSAQGQKEPKSSLPSLLNQLLINQSAEYSYMPSLNFGIKADAGDVHRVVVRHVATGGNDEGTGKKEGKDDDTGKKEGKDDDTGKKEGKDDDTGKKEGKDDGTGKKEGKGDGTGKKEGKDDGTGKKEGKDDGTGKKEGKYVGTGKDEGKNDGRGKNEGKDDGTGKNEERDDGREQNEIYQLRLQSLRIKTLRDMKDKKMRAASANQALEVFQEVARQEGWTNATLWSKIHSYVDRSNTEEGRKFLEDTVNKVDIDDRKQAAVDGCRRKESGTRELEEDRAIKEFWSAETVSLHNWLEDMRVEKCADTLSGMISQSDAEEEESQFRALDKTSARGKWGDEEYVQNLQKLLAEFTVNHRIGVSERANKLYADKLEKDADSAEAQIVIENDLENKANLRLAAENVRNDIYKSQNAKAEREEWSKSELDSSLERALKKFKEDYTYLVQKALSSLERNRAKEKENIVEAFKKDAELKMKARKSDLFSRVNGTEYEQKMTKQKIKAGLDQRLQREFEKIDLDTRGKLSPSAVFRYLEKERLLRSRLVWLKGEVEKLIQQERVKSQVYLASQLAIIKSPRWSPLVVKGKRTEAKKQAKMLLDNQMKMISQAEVAFQQLPIAYDSFATEKLRSVVLHREVENVRQANSLLNRKALEAPYRWGQRRLQGAKRASSFSVQILEEKVHILRSNLHSNRSNLPPEIDPIFLGIETTFAFRNVLESDIKDALLDLRFVHDRQFKLSPETRTKLSSMSSTLDAKLNVPVSDAFDWQVFSRALKTLASKNKCGAIYCEKKGCYGICCLFKVAHASERTFSFCFEPEMIGLPAPPRMTVPEFGIQFGLPKLLQSLPEGMNTAIMEKLAAWDRPKLEEVIKVLRLQSELRQSAYQKIRSIDDAANARLYEDFIHGGGYSMNPRRLETWFNVNMKAIIANAKKEKEAAIFELILKYSNIRVGDDLDLVWRVIHETLGVNLEQLSQCSSDLLKDSNFLTKKEHTLFLQKLAFKQSKCDTLLLAALSEYRENIIHIIEFFGESAETLSKDRQLLMPIIQNDPTTQPDNVVRNEFSESPVIYASSSGNENTIAQPLNGPSILSYDTSVPFLLTFQYEDPVPFSFNSKNTTPEPEESYLTGQSCQKTESGYCNVLCCDALQMYSPRCKMLLKFCY